MMNETRRRSQAHFDWPLLVAVYALAALGILCITMATYDASVNGDQPLLNKILSSRSGMWQSIFLMVSPVVIGVIMAIPTEIYKARARLAYVAVLGLLVVTLVAGQVSNGLKGWLKSSILGRSIQPCEFAKLGVLLMLARQLSRSEKPMGNMKEFFRVLVGVGIPSAVVLLQGETGSVLVILFMFLVMIYFAGVDLRIILGIAAVGAVGIGVVVAYGLMADDPDYRILRLLAFLDPSKYYQTGGYQLLRCQEVIGRGGMTGIGTFVECSCTSLGYVPESSTDAIFTVVAESFGFVGCVAVLLVYLFIIVRMLYLARFTNDKFGQLVIIGVMAMLLFHIFENVAMDIGYMPITGIPLPFVSYGGSNFITNVAGVALVLNVTRGRSAAAMLTVPLPRINSGRRTAKG